jgi:glucose-1-phosphate thymidylyltransferase
MWGIIPAAGAGSRIQPLAFSKELLPVGSRHDGAVERPKAVSEYLLERMIRAGANNIAFVIGAGKHDILEYYGGSVEGTNLCYVVQPKPSGLCDAIFRVLPLVAPHESVLVGLPDTIWFPEDGFTRLGDDTLSFLLFPSAHPELFDAVRTDGHDQVQEVRVKQPADGPAWVWGAFKMPGHVLAALHDLWLRRDRQDEYLGTLVNAYLAEGGSAKGIHAGEAYVDVGTLNGYREAVRLLAARDLVIQYRQLAGGSS